MNVAVFVDLDYYYYSIYLFKAQTFEFIWRSNFLYKYQSEFIFFESPWVILSSDSISEPKKGKEKQKEREILVYLNKNHKQEEEEEEEEEEEKEEEEEEKEEEEEEEEEEEDFSDY